MAWVWAGYQMEPYLRGFLPLNKGIILTFRKVFKNVENSNQPINLRSYYVRAVKTNLKDTYYTQPKEGFLGDPSAFLFRNVILFEDKK